MSASRFAPLLLVALVGACAPLYEGDDPTADSSDLSRVPTSVKVNGHSYDVESVYLPRVVQCENPHAPPESLRAQAIAARTFLTNKTRGQAQPTIRDGEADQVFTCAANHNGTLIPAAVLAAVQATRGQVMLHNNLIISGNFVAGAMRTASCGFAADPQDPHNTQRFVTLNAGRTGTAVRASAIGNRSNPSNRGCMGQLLANCIATRDSLVASQILQYFYGSDIEIRGLASGPPVPVPSENDPAVAPPMPTSGAMPPPPVNPDMPSNPEPTNIDPDPAMTALPATCWSYTLQRWAQTNECVQSVADRMWYQCQASTSWAGPLDPATGMGPGGACVMMSAL